MKRTYAVILVFSLLCCLLAGCNQNGVNDVKLSEVHEKVKAAYGEDYLPNMQAEKADVATKTGVPEADIEECIAEFPLMSAQVDTFIAIKAAQGKGESVEKALNAYRDTLVSDTLTYPMNQEKVKASRVVRHGDYVFFLLLGATEEVEDGQDPTADFAGKQVQKGVDAVEEFFK